MTKAQVIKLVDVWPLMLIHAQDTKHAGAARLHVLASTLDHNEGCNHVMGICKGGSGKVLRRDLEAAAMQLGVKRSTYYSWLADAREAGILKGEGEYLYLASNEKLDKIYLCNSQDERKAIIPLKLLFKPGWKSLVWQAYLKANHHKQKTDHEGNKLYKKDLTPVMRGKVISARTLEGITGVLPRQQRRLNQGANKRSNFAITTISGSWEKAAELNAAAQDQGQDRHYFTFNDPQQKDPAGVKDYRRVIAHTIPMQRTVKDSTAKQGAKGRRRSIDATHKKGLRLVTFCNYSTYQALPRQADNSETFVQFERRYFDDYSQVEKYLSRHELNTEREKFLPRRVIRYGAMGVWDRTYA